tara:strand:- start:1597 stop:2196 length:600 start_codon:yes stop_codon:yes gene_type:complete
MKIVDLYSGLGGASEWFLREGWEVLRIDNNELLKDVPNTMMADLTKTDWAINAHWHQPDLVWASPPCLDFSRGYNAPGPKAQREGEEFEPDMEPLRSAIRWIKLLKPKYWIIENVAGASKIFSKELGVNAPRQIIGPYFLWGIFPHITMDYDWTRPKGKTQDWNIGDPLRANKRAKIPLEVSRNVFRAITQQRQLTEWY